MKRICLKDQEISELNCTDDFNWQECSDTVPKYLENTSCNQYGHNKNTLCTNEVDRKEIIETMKTSETKSSPAMERPIHKVVLLHKTETREVPTEEPLCIFVKKIL